MKKIAKYFLITACVLLAMSLLVFGFSIMRFSSQFNSGLDTPLFPHEGETVTAVTVNWTADQINSCRVSTIYLLKGTQKVQLRFRYSDQNTSTQERDLLGDTVISVQDSSGGSLGEEITVSGAEIMGIPVLEIAVTMDAGILDTLPSGGVTVSIESAQGRVPYASCVLKVAVVGGQYADVYVEDFSYAEDSARFPLSCTEGPFENTESTALETGYDALIRARKEVSIPYNKVEVDKDREKNIWRVTFSTTGDSRTQRIYMDENGITLASVTAE